MTTDNSNPHRRRALWDIETGPLAREVVLSLAKPFPAFQPPEVEAPKPAPAFSEEAIKEQFATARDPEKGPAFIAKKREEFEAKAKTAAADAEAKAKAKLEKARAEHEAKRAAHYAEAMERATLSPLTARVEAIGVITEFDEFLILEGSEQMILMQFWRFASSCRNGGIKLVGWNTEGFDLPFLVRRSWAVGVTVPEWLIQGRNFSPLLVDLMKLYCLHQYGQFAKLGDAARFLIGEGKDESEDMPTGANFWSWYREGGDKRTAALRYLERDLRLTGGILDRIQLCTALPQDPGGELVGDLIMEGAA